MRNKHWLAIADALRLVRPQAFDNGEKLWTRTVESIADALDTVQNARCVFNRRQWVEYVTRR